MDDARAEVPNFKKFLYANRKLNDAGVGSIIDLPRTVVVGMQSSGKSSLLEVLSGVEFPRNSGTCTRQPTELRLENCPEDQPFQGTIKIRWGKEKGAEDLKRWIENPEGIDFSGLADASASTRMSSSVGNEYWDADSKVEDDFSSSLNAKNESVIGPNDTIRIRSKSAVAQLLLDVTRRLLGANPIGFSDSVIVLHIVDHSVSDFEAIDTPGVVETGFPDHVINWLKEMISGYMRQENTIIMAALECTGDIQNQKMLDLVLEADPSQKRTKLVLTKADRIELGDEDRWLDIVRGGAEWAEKYACVHGAHIVRARTPMELQNSVPEVERLAAEKEFFEERQWSGISEDCYGTWTLKTELGTLLGELMARCLPDLQEKVQVAKIENSEKLSALPEDIPEDTAAQRRHLLRSMIRFSEKLGKLFALDSSDEGFAHLYAHVNELNAKFVGKILSSCPPKQPDARTVTIGATVEFHDSEVDNLWKTGIVKCFQDGNVIIHWPDCPQWGSRTKEQTEVALTKRHTDADDDASKPFDSKAAEQYMKTVREYVRIYQRRNLPGTVSPCVQRRLIKECVAKWQTPSTRYLANVAKLVHERVFALIDENFRSLARLRVHLRKASLDILKSTRERAEERIQYDLEMERESHFTLNGNYLRKIQSRHDEREVKTTPDKVDELLQLVASVDAYVKVASKRFADYVPMIVDSYLMRGFHKEFSELAQALCCELPRREIEGLLSEDNRTAKLRRELRANAQALETAEGVLQEIV